MSTSPNPYQAPTTLEMHPAAAHWLAAPSVSLTRVARGLGVMYTGIVLMLLTFVLLFGLAFVPASPDAKLLMLKADGVVLSSAC